MSVNLIFKIAAVGILVSVICQVLKHSGREEQAFLTELKESGLNIKGIEDQLTATGMSVCSDESITRDAVAGQLVEQRRTDMDPDALGQLLTDSARAHLC